MGESINAAEIKKILEENEERLRKARFFITLRTEGPIGEYLRRVKDDSENFVIHRRGRKKNR